jgi:hypothetical protein
VEVHRRSPTGMGLGHLRRAHRREALLAPLCALALPAVAAASGLSPPRLIDGSKPPAVPKVLGAEGRSFVMTKVRVVPAKQINRLVAACARFQRLPAGTAVVERVGVNGRSITFRKPGSGIEGCDRNPKARPIQTPWCGGAAWTLRHGRLSDPRLDVCFDRESRPVVAFGWINPVARAKWIVIDQPGYREVYPVAGRLPVRVSTTSEIGGRQGAVFRMAQYDGQGVLLVRRKVVAAIAS